MKYGTLLLLTILSSVSLMTAKASAEITTSISYKYYNVDIEEERSTFLQVLKSSPISIDGNKQFSQTVCNNNFTFTKESIDEKNCKTSDLKITSHCEMLRPRITSDDSFIQERFEQYLEKVKEYELAHIKINNDYLEKFESAITSKSDYECSQIHDSINELFRRYSESIKSDRKKWTMTLYTVLKWEQT